MYALKKFAKVRTPLTQSHHNTHQSHHGQSPARGHGSHENSRRPIAPQIGPQIGPQPQQHHDGGGGGGGGGDRSRWTSQRRLPWRMQLRKRKQELARQELQRLRDNSRYGPQTQISEWVYFFTIDCAQGQNDDISSYSNEVRVVP